MLTTCGIYGQVMRLRAQNGEGGPAAPMARLLWRPKFKRVQRPARLRSLGLHVSLLYLWVISGGGLLSRELAATKLISLAYGTVGEMGRWPEVLAGFQSFVGADVLIQLTANTSSVVHKTELTSRQHVFGINLDMASRYAELAPRSPMALKVTQTPVATVATHDRMMPFSEFERSEFYDQWVKPAHLRTALFGTLLRSDSRIALLNFMRTGVPGPRPFDDLDPAIGLVMPHLARVLQLNLKLAEAGLTPSGAVAAMLDALSTAVACVRGDGEVLWMNTAAERLVAEGDGLLLLRNKQLGASSPGATSHLQRLWDSMALGQGESVSIERPSGRLALCLTSVPLKGKRLDESMAVLGTALSPTGLVAFVEPDSHLSARQSGVLQQRLRGLYGLTQAEAVIAVMVSQLGGLPAVASTLGLSQSTVHTHLRRVFAKLQAQGQPELARRLEALRLLD